MLFIFSLFICGIQGFGYIMDYCILAVLLHAHVLARSLFTLSFFAVDASGWHPFLLFSLRSALVREIRCSDCERTTNQLHVCN
ncbi:hypothetical protein BDV98DRAFT_164746 [Pterulicium gracile]|uniref:Uncharacterized protein n=1 Tax=Pterulicium gracile TaxID=1884261 RepID=A0A5C3QXQ7_9AGAR|nr:hypothetical protein BDV98DRAFT_164746 [Pterula gracilis]